MGPKTFDAGAEEDFPDFLVRFRNGWAKDGHLFQAVANFSVHVWRRNMFSTTHGPAVFLFFLPGIRFAATEVLNGGQMIDIKSLIKETIRDVMCDHELLVNDNDTLESLGLDSVDIIDFACEIHLKVGFKSDVQKFGPLMTVKDVIRQVAEGAFEFGAVAEECQQPGIPVCSVRHLSDDGKSAPK